MVVYSYGNKPRPLLERLFRYFGTTDLEAVKLGYAKILQMGGLDRSLEVASEVINYKFPSYVISKTLLQEIQRVDFTPDYDMAFPRCRVFIPEPSHQTFYDETGKIWGTGDVFDFEILEENGKIEIVKYPWCKAVSESVDADNVNAPVVMGLFSIERKDLPKTPQLKVLCQCLHYIQKLGKPDLRKGLYPTTRKPKKIRQILQRDEFLFDHEMVTLGFGKERRNGKEFWGRQAHLRVQPYGPRDNPRYKTILIEEQIIQRRKSKA